MKTRDKMPMKDIFINNFIPSGLVLLAVIGLPQIAAALLLFKQHPKVPYAVLACGILLMLCIVVEWWAWGLNTLSNIFFILGLAEVAIAMTIITKRND